MVRSTAFFNGCVCIYYMQCAFGLFQFGQHLEAITLCLIRFRRLHISGRCITKDFKDVSVFCLDFFFFSIYVKENVSVLNYGWWSRWFCLLSVATHDVTPHISSLVIRSLFSDLSIQFPLFWFRWGKSNLSCPGLSFLFVYCHLVVWPYS